MSEGAVQQVWVLSLVIYLVVLIVVAVLLTMILRTARQIRGGVSAIWTVGQKVANNTIHIPLLVKTNQVANQILESAKGVVVATAAVQSHAEGCPSCPSCVLGRR
jgi:K+ transporter